MLRQKPHHRFWPHYRHHAATLLAAVSQADAELRGFDAQSADRPFGCFSDLLDRRPRFRVHVKSLYVA